MMLHNHKITWNSSSIVICTWLSSSNEKKQINLSLSNIGFMLVGFGGWSQQCIEVCFTFVGVYSKIQVAFGEKICEFKS